MSTNAAKIDFSNFSNLEEITSQRYPPQVFKSGYFLLKNEFKHEKEFYVHNHSLRPKIDLPCQF